MLPTKGKLQNKIGQWTGWVVAALVGAGVALSLSIIFLAPGVALIGLGVGVALLGWMVRSTVSLVIPSRRLACPHCQAVSEIFNGSGAFGCDGCYRVVPVATALPVPELVLDEPITYSVGRRMLILFAALSFIAFFIEVYLGHYARFQLFFQGLTFSAALVPIFFSPIGLVVAMVAAIRLTPATVLAFNGTMLATILVGMGGSYFHMASRLTSLASLTSVATWLGDPPALAPFAFALPGIMGLVATFGIRWVERLPGEAAPGYRPASPMPGPVQK